MPNLDLPIGESLDGWRVEEWIQLEIYCNERYKFQVCGYFLNQEEANKKKSGEYKYKTNTVKVLTSDGKFGYLISEGIVQKI